MLAGKEWVLVLEVNVDLSLGHSIHFDNNFSFFIGVFPSIYEMEHIMVWKFKPLHGLGVQAVSLHNSVPCWLSLVKMENELALGAEIRSKLHRQVWDDSIRLSDHEVMDHSWR